MKEYEELVKALLYCKEHDQCDKDSSAECPYEHHWTDGEDCQNLLLAAAADAFEAADKRIDELEKQIKNYRNDKMREDDPLRPMWPNWD